jgi:hypothetical protein
MSRRSASRRPADGETSGYSTAASAASFASAKSSTSSTAGRGTVGDYVAPVGSSLLDRVRQAELDFLFAVQRFRRRMPMSLRYVFDRLISSHPLYDLSLAAWMAVPPAMLYTGPALMWMIVANIFLSFGLSWMLNAAVPTDLDPRLKPRGRVSPSGFPCVELHLATVLFIALVFYFPHAAAIVACAGLLLLLFVLRLYALTHFPHQLLGSVALGALTVPLLRAFGRSVFPKGIHPQNHVLAGVFVGMIFIGYIAYKAETNDAPILRIPKSEFVRVVGDILVGDDASLTQARQAAQGAGAGAGSRAASGDARTSSGRNDGSTSDSASISSSRGVRFEDSNITSGSNFPPAGPRGAGTGLNAPRLPPAGPQPLAGPARLPPVGPQAINPASRVISKYLSSPATTYDSSAGEDNVRQARAAFARTALASLAAGLVAEGSATDSEADSVSLINSNARSSNRGAEGDEDQMADPARRDSFFYLMRGMQQRRAGGSRRAATDSEDF